MRSAVGSADRIGLRLPRLSRKRAKPAADAAVAVTAVSVAPGLACETGTQISPDIRLFHDADKTLPVFREPSGVGVALETNGFDGTYISQVIELDADMALEMRAGRNLIVDLEAEAEPAIPTYLRAHFSNEEGREQLHDLIVVATGPRTVRFNLDGLRLPLDLATTVWVDVIYSHPAGTALALMDLKLRIAEQ